MKFAIDLRSDLRQLDDAELAARSEEGWAEYRETRGKVTIERLRWSSRGPIRHPFAYPVTSFLSYSGPFYWKGGLALGTSLMSLLPGGSRFRALMRMHLALCEIRDVMDEIERRCRLSSSPRQ